MSKRTGVPMSWSHLSPCNSTLLSIAKHMAPDAPKDKKKRLGQGRSRGHAILTQQQVAEINDRRARGQTVTQIARCMKVSIGSVRGVVYYGNGARTLGK